MKDFRLFLVVLAICALSFSCTKEEDWSTSIPYARVEIDIQTQIDNKFDIPLHYECYYSGKNGVQHAGYVGVIAISDETASNIYAYDLCCPYESPQKNELVMDGAMRLKCPKCGSKFDLLNKGRVAQGPSEERLRSYAVYRSGKFYRIRN